MRNLQRVIVFVAWLGMGFVANGQTVDTLRVMTFNVWTGENSASGRDKLVEIIQAANADIVGLQEVNNSAGQQIADALGFHYHQQSGGDIQVVSRFPIIGQSTGNRGVEIAVSPTQNVWLFNSHLAAYPYQPYDLRDGTLAQNEAAVIAAANAARGGQVTTYLNEMQTALSSGLPVFFTGDFNEPSHLDWTAAAAAATARPYDLQVEYPASRRVVDAGLTDSFRAARPDEVNDPAYTWTPGYPPPNLTSDEVHDRIDFVYHSGHGVTPTSAQTLGLDASNINTDIGITGYNADHRAVVVEFTIPGCVAMPGDLDGNCQIDAADWEIFRANQHGDFTGMTAAQTALLGDLNGDLRNDHADFVIFKSTYESVNGVGSFAVMLNSVPEPTSVSVMVLGSLILSYRIKSAKIAVRDLAAE